MTHRWRKLVGTIALLALVTVYAIVAVTVASARLAEAGPAIQLGFFFITGLIWVLPAMLLIRWMAGSRPPVDR